MPKGAVPDLQRRMGVLHDNGGRVVLVHAKQGTCSAVATGPARVPSQNDDHLRLIHRPSRRQSSTAGAFPALLRRAVPRAVAPGQAAAVTLGGTSITDGPHRG